MINDEFGVLIFMLIFSAFILFAISRFWNSPDDPRGQQLSWRQLFNFDSE
jgi:hypothetical protein